MSTAMGSLPQELLSLIFENNDSVAHLAEYRLVCRVWSTAAERTMVGKKITIKSERQAAALCIHMWGNPSLQSLIRHLHFELDEPECPTDVRYLLLTNITPNIRKLTGSVRGEGFFTTLMISYDLHGLNRLEDILKYTGENEEMKSRIFTKFRSIIRVLTLTLADPLTSSKLLVVNELNKCENLRFVSLRGHVNDLESVENVLKRCAELKGLQIVDLTIGEFGADSIQRGNLMTWVASNVKKVDTLQAVEIRSGFRPELIEYILYKYPNVQKIKIEGTKVYKDVMSLFDGDALDRILDTIKQFKSKQLHLWLPQNVRMFATLETWASSEKNLRYNVERYKDQIMYSMQLD